MASYDDKYSTVKRSFLDRCGYKRLAPKHWSLHLTIICTLLRKKNVVSVLAHQPSLSKPLSNGDCGILDYKHSIQDGKSHIHNPVWPGNSPIQYGSNKTQSVISIVFGYYVNVQNKERSNMDGTMHTRWYIITTNRIIVRTNHVEYVIDNISFTNCGRFMFALLIIMNVYVDSLHSRCVCVCVSSQIHKKSTQLRKLFICYRNVKNTRQFMKAHICS
jgi:hypothetical protein